MKVLLTKNVSGLGQTGDIREVSDGHARNFLIPRGLAVPATSGVLQKVQKEEAEHQAKVKRQQEQFENLRKKIESKTFTIKAKADKEHLFAQIRENEIASAVNKQFPNQVEANQIVIEKPIKSLGTHTVSIRLAHQPPIKVNLQIEQI